MSEPINTGRPAFPIPLHPGQSWQGMAPCDGMTLRDYFAAKAMQGLFSVMGNPIELQRAMKKGGHETPHAWVAGTDYEMADAMIAARERGAS